MCHPDVVRMRFCASEREAKFFVLESANVLTPICRDSTAPTERPYKWVGHNKNRYLSACRPIVVFIFSDWEILRFVFFGWHIRRNRENVKHFGDCMTKNVLL